MGSFFWGTRYSLHVSKGRKLLFWWVSVETKCGEQRAEARNYPRTKHQFMEPEAGNAVRLGRSGWGLASPSCPLSSLVFVPLSVFLKVSTEKVAEGALGSQQKEGMSKYRVINLTLDVAHSDTYAL